MKLEPRQVGEAVVVGGEAEMLSGEDQAWDDSAIRERMRQPGQCNRFGPGADDERNNVTAQRSP